MQDFGDGGAFPEIIVSQFPLNMGRPNNKSSSNALAVQLDAEGRVKYDVLARQGHRPDKVSSIFYVFRSKIISFCHLTLASSFGTTIIAHQSTRNPNFLPSESLQGGGK